MEYPGIAKAALEVAYDNGGINRERAEEAFLSDLHTHLVIHSSTRDLAAIDAWLSNRTDDELGVICSGEEGEMLDALKDAPDGAHELLNEIFETVV